MDAIDETRHAGRAAMAGSPFAALLAPRWRSHHRVMSLPRSRSSSATRSWTAARSSSMCRRSQRTASSCRSLRCRKPDDRDRLREVRHVFAEGNPHAGRRHLQFTPECGKAVGLDPHAPRADAEHRAIAEMSNGQLFIRASRSESDHRRLRRLSATQNDRSRKSWRQPDPPRPHSGEGEGRRNDRDQDADLARDGKRPAQGFRRQRVPRKIINKFTATFNGKTVFEADWHPAISANPYQSFFYKAAEIGRVQLRLEG